jgi:type IV fimbrial biogenesis protein FimT
MREACNRLTMDRDSGFTLIELLITIVVVSILLAMGAPAFKDFIKNNRVTAQTNDLVSAIQLARSEALKRGTNMVVCASKNQTTCTGKDTWADGWIVFSDLNLNNSPDLVGTGKCLETEECIMMSRTKLPDGTALTTQPGNDTVRFLPTGLADNNVGGVKTVEFTLKARNCEKHQARKVTVTQQGHTLVATVACS